MSADRVRLVAGAMTGTSLDGIDVALVRVRGRGRGIDATLLDHRSLPLGPLATPLRRLAGGEPVAADAVAALARDLGALHAEAIAGLARDGAGPPLDLVAAHGQTVAHAPPLSWQLLDPAPIAHRLRCPVVCDLRAADLAAGGQGAPITPAADAVLFGGARRGRTIVNLGGFANATVLPPLPGATEPERERDWDRIRGFDVCARNHVLDAVARDALDAPFDADGRAAASGAPDDAAVAALAALLGGQAAAGRSLGPGDEAAAWVRDHAGALAPADLAASAVAAVARTIAGTLAARSADETPAATADELVLAGGGARNAALVAALEAALVAALGTATEAPVVLSDAHGIPVEAREAAAMAVLGALCADGVPITLPRITGCGVPAPVAGRWSSPPRGMPIP